MRKFIALVALLFVLAVPGSALAACFYNPLNGASGYYPEGYIIPGGDGYTYWVCHDYRWVISYGSCGGYNNYCY